MRLSLEIGMVCLAAALASPAAFGQQAAPRAKSASSESTGDSPYLGVMAENLTAERAKALKLKDDTGVEVTFVEPDSAAAKAGLKVGDAIVDFNGQKLESWEQLVRLVRETPIHRDVKLKIWRGGAEQTLTANMGSRRAVPVEIGPGSWGGSTPGWVQPVPPMAPTPPPVDIPQLRSLMLMGTSSLGIMGESLGQESQLAEFFGVKDGVLVHEVNRDSAAEKAGIKAGDVITKIDDTPISSTQQIAGALRAARNKGSVNVVIVRSKKEMTVTVTPDANGWYRGALWSPDGNLMLQLFTPGTDRKIVWQ